MKSRKNFKQILLLLSLTILLIYSCNKETTLPALEINYNYYPLKEKSVLIYDVDSTAFSDFNNSEVLFQFQLKDTTTNKYLDAQGDTTYRIERYKKTNNTWVFQKIINRKLLKNRAEEIMDNRRYVRLIFPQRLDVSWNGNLYNDLDEWRYHFLEINQPAVINNISLDSTIVIEQYNEVNLIREDVYNEVYAKNIGLVIKHIKAVDKDINSGRIKKGYEFNMRINSYR